MNPQVTKYINDAPNSQQEIVKRVRSIILENVEREGESFSER